VPAAFQHEYRRVFDEADRQPQPVYFVDDSLTGATIGGPSGDIIDAGLDDYHLQFHEKVFTALIARGWRIFIAKCLFLTEVPVAYGGAPMWHAVLVQAPRFAPQR